MRSNKFNNLWDQKVRKTGFSHNLGLCSAQYCVVLVDTLGLCESADMQDFPGIHGTNVVLGQG